MERKEVAYHRECKCMRAIRAREGKYFRNANKRLCFLEPSYEIQSSYFTGVAYYPVTYVFTYRNVFGSLAHAECRCRSLTHWEQTLPKSVVRSIQRQVRMHQTQAKTEMCQCGKDLIGYLKRRDPEGMRTYYCKTVAVEPPRYIYRVHGNTYSHVCECNQPHRAQYEFSDSETEEDDSDSDDDAVDHVAHHARA